MLKTEMRNENSMHIDKMDTLSMVKLINEENKKSVNAVDEALPAIAAVCDAAAASLEKGGRIFYVGAGTSGRIGVMDAAECPPTFGVEKDRVIGIIAGGAKCMTMAAEAEEDNAKAGREDIARYGLNEKDIVIGISASGGADYVMGALLYANSVGACSVSISSNSDTPIEHAAKLHIVVDTGAEVITGSTRMKSGTAQKLVCNMLTTASMIKLGKVYQNLMVDLKATNEKLVARSIAIICETTDYNKEEATKLFYEYHDVKAVILSYLLDMKDKEKIDTLLKKYNRNINKILKENMGNKNEN